MRRFFLLLLNEFKMFRTALVVHMIAILQPTLMYMLMAVIMVVPTFDMYVVQPETQLGQELLAAMEEVGSPIGPDYINPILVSEADPGYRQVVAVLEVDGFPTALQRYGYIDSNLVKNLRNRLTAAALVLWNQKLGSQAVTIKEHPWMPRDVPYTVYFGMAMVPLAAYLAASMIGGYLMAQEFENETILEYRLCPTSPLLLLAARITRLLLTGLVAAGILYTALGLISGVWASSTLAVFFILLPLTLVAGCIGLLAGLLTRSSLPSFLAALSSAFGFWLLGSGFGLAAGFPPAFERISRLIPNTPIVEMLFPYFYFGRQVAAYPIAALLQLIGYCLLLLALVVLVYHRRVLTRQR
ncbi:MAG: ABC transporter permease [Anaerolineaceae bacterium]|nr:ABC transporter permease [Anaerolineaceae bacterium]